MALHRTDVVTSGAHQNTPTLDLPTISTRALDRHAMAHDASHYLLVPEGVATPTGADEVAQLFRLSHARRTPITFRSGGTSLSGQGVTDGLLVDVRRHFRRIEVLDSGARVRVQPGATVRQVNAHLAPYGRKLGPDPASEIACTIGGVVSNNSSGMACGTAQNTYQTLDSMIFVLPSGTVVDTAASDADEVLRLREPDLYAGLDRLRDRVWTNPESIATITQQFSMKNTMGYGLNSFLDHTRPVDVLAHLIVGGEGTLAFVAEATFRTVPLFAHAATGLAVFADLSKATGSLPDLVATGLATIELLDATSLRVAQTLAAATPELRALVVESHAALLVEFQASSAEEVQHLVDASAGVFADLPAVADTELTTESRRRADLWHIRKGLYTSVAGARPSGTTALLEDVVVPVAGLLPTCAALTELFTQHGYGDSVIFGHAKDGNIHFMLNERFDGVGRLEAYQRFTGDMVELVLSHQGSLKAEHGTGRIMAPFVWRQYGDELYAVMVAVKRLCDPTGLLNPGVVINDDPLVYVQDLKTTPTVESEVDRCVECGYCEPTCPSKDLTVTPRQRIVLRREIEAARQAGDSVLVAELERDYTYAGVETCAADGLCQVACPVNIDTGDLVRRLRREDTGRVEDRLWDVAAKHWGTAANLGGKALTVADHVPAPLLTGPSHVARRLVGTDTVPLWSSELPGGGTARQPRAATDPAAVYVPACIQTLFGAVNPGAGVTPSLLALCDRAGVEVVIPDGIADFCCGTPWKSKGKQAGHDRMTERVLPALWAASDHGRIPVICDAASCTEGLQTMRDLASAPASPYEALTFVDAVQFVADHVLDRLNVTQPLASLVVHPTCSSTELGLATAMDRIARAVSDDVTVPTDWGCCAFAGDRGLLHPELTASATAVEAAEVRRREYAAYASVNRTCELGMTRATGRPYRHLLELLADATISD